MSTDLIELVQSLGEPRVLVLGDLMLDRYVWGDAARISQEAPVILLQADKREERLGGASSVATMLSALADPIRGSDYRKYHGCSAITPNRLEAGLATGRVLGDTVLALEAAAELRERLDLEAAIVTLDKEGMALVHTDGRSEVFPTRPRQ